MKKFKITAICTVLIATIIASCGPKQFYEQTENGLEYYFFKKNKEAKMGQIGDIYNLNITATTKRDSLVFSEHGMFKRHEAIYPGDFHDGLSMLHEGDSVGFVLHTDSFFQMHNLNTPKGLTGKETFKLLIGVEAILSPLDHMIYKSEQELVKMTEFVERKGWETIKDSTGTVIAKLSGNLGDVYSPPIDGDTITVEFTSDKSEERYGFDIVGISYQ